MGGGGKQGKHETKPKAQADWASQRIMAEIWRREIWRRETDLPRCDYVLIWQIRRRSLWRRDFLFDFAGISLVGFSFPRIWWNPNRSNQMAEGATGCVLILRSHSTSTSDSILLIIGILCLIYILFIPRGITSFLFLAPLNLYNATARPPQAHQSLWCRCDPSIQSRLRW